jgi:hypothetical protein
MVIAEAERTLVKSPPELWNELSDPAALARHLGGLGEIRIVRTLPEQSVEWEAHEHTRGTVEIKPAGWGTKVTLSVTIEQPCAEPPLAEPRDDALAVPQSPAPAHAEVDDDGAGEPAPMREPERSPAQAMPPPAGPPCRPADTGTGIKPRRSLSERLSRLWRRRRAVRRGDTAADDGKPLRDGKPKLLAGTPVAPEAAERGEPEAAADDPTPTAVAAHATTPASAPGGVASPVAASPARERDHHAEQQAAEQTTALLSAVLDSLGEAHHRPFSRS